MRFKDQVFIITGAGQGIGKFFAQRVAQEGAKVVIAEYNDVTGKTVVDEITAKGFEAWFVKTDVSDEQSTQAMAKSSIEKYDRIDVLINNAAVFSTLGLKPFDQIPVNEWDRVMAVNLKGYWLCCKAVVPFMKNQKKGKIINTGSCSWNFGRAGYLHYVSSKAGIVGFTRGLASEVGDWNINVNCIAYGGVITETERDSWSPEAQKEAFSRQCIKREPVPSELVGTIIFLASEDSDFLTGQTIHVNGGLYFH